MTRKGIRKVDTLLSEDVLRLLRTDELLVDTRNGKTYKRQRDGSVRELNPSPDRSGRMFFRIYSDGKRRGIARARLVYIAKTLEGVPPGMDVDHIDGDNQHDDFVNLQLLTPAENRGKNNYPRENETWDVCDEGDF